MKAQAIRRLGLHLFGRSVRNSGDQRGPHRRPLENPTFPAYPWVWRREGYFLWGAVRKDIRRWIRHGSR